MNIMARAALAASLLALSACALPTNEMTAEQRKSDMEWAFSIFKTNYAPAELKKSNYGVDMTNLEAQCVKLAEKEMDNPAFIALFQRCIHSFKDAHVGAQQMNNGILPEYAEVAHLGFVTMRTKAIFNGESVNALRIISQLKGSDTPGAPLIPGDLILSVDGKAIGRYLMDEIVPFIDVGQDETSLTQAAFRFGLRTSTDMDLPEEDDVKLLVARESMVFEITLPWIREDLLAFQLKQNPPEEGQQGNPTAPQNPHSGDEGDAQSSVKSYDLLNPLAQSFFGYDQLKSILSMIETPVAAISDRVQLIAKTGYRLAKFNPILNSLFKGELDKGGEIDLAIRTRIFPMAAEVNDLMDTPKFTAKMVTTDEGQTYAYIQITSFPSDDEILPEWHRAITAIEDKGIKSVIIDMIDNGGGSLVHGMRMVNMLRRMPLELPSMQLRLNNNWMNSFKTQAAFGSDDYAKTIASRVVKQLEEDLAAGKKLSRPISVTVMDPFFLQNPGYGLSSDVKIALLVNEMCVSMCDIFASVFQENEMGLLIGQRTMGGGGNVVQHGLSPVAKMGIALTESLMISPKGKYLEDFGVTPEVQVDMVADRERGFQEAFSKAYQYIMPPAPAPQPAPAN